jgi:hypothetical protein
MPTYIEIPINGSATGTSSNTPNTLVLRDGSGNFDAGTITATLNGNASTATTATSATSATTATSVSGTVAVANGGTGLTTTTTGDIIYSSATNTLAKLGVGSLSSLLVSGSNGLPQWQDSNKLMVYNDDFVSGYVNANWAGFAAAGTGALLAADVSFGAANPGVWKCVTGTTTTGYALLANASANLFIGAGSAFYETVINLSALSDGTNRYQVDVGCFDIQISAFANGICWRYIDTLNGGNWTLNSTKTSTSTQVNSGVAAAATTWVRLGWLLNAAGTSIQGYVNGVASGSPITTNIPTARMFICRTMSLDRASMVIELTTAR